MHVGDAEMHRKPFVDTIEAKDPGGGQIRSCVEAIVVVDRAPRDADAGNAPSAAILSGSIVATDNRFDDVPLPGEVGCGFPIARVRLQPLRDEGPDSHGGQESHSQHPLPYRRHELRAEQVSDLVEPEGIERALAGSWRIRGCQER